MVALLDRPASTESEKDLGSPDRLSGKIKNFRSAERDAGTRRIAQRQN